MLTEVEILLEKAKRRIQNAIKVFETEDHDLVISLTCKAIELCIRTIPVNKGVERPSNTCFSSLTKLLSSTILRVHV